MNHILVSIFLMLMLQIHSQQIISTNFTPINFGGSGVTITPKVGTGLNIGNIVLYQNVLSIGGQQIDAIITTTGLQNGTYSDYDNTSSDQGNQQRWFSPRLSFNSGGGFVTFNIQFIEGGSYNNSTNEGVGVILADVILNTYDIDGNGGANTNQYAEFEGFDYVEIGNPTTLNYSYDSSSGLTQFVSTISTNNTNASSEQTRVRCTYSFISEIDIRMGSNGSGWAYFFLDFSAGSNFNSSTSLEVPRLDLDTDVIGIDNDSLFLFEEVSFTKGLINIEYSLGELDRMMISFDRNDITDDSDELLVFGNSGISLNLDFVNGTTLPTVVLGGVNYSIILSVSNGISSLEISRLDGTKVDLTDLEFFLDNLNYNNLNATPTSGFRAFDVSVIDGDFESSVAIFTVEIPTYLPVDLMYFECDCSTKSLRWATASESGSDHFEVLISPDAKNWDLLGIIPSYGNSQDVVNYDLPFNADHNFSYVKLIQYDTDGRSEEFDILHVNCGKTDYSIYPNPFEDVVTISFGHQVSGNVNFTLFDLFGTKVFESIEELDHNGRVSINVGNLNSGVYHYQLRTSGIQELGKLSKI